MKKEVNMRFDSVSKKSAAVLLLLALAVHASFSQDITLDAVCAGLASHKVTTGNFTQEKKINDKRTLKSFGTFVLSASGIALNTQKPLKTSMAVTENSFIQVTADGTRSVMDASSNEVFRSVAGTVYAMFSGDKEELERNFTIDFSSQSDGWRMVLEPKDQTIASAIKSVTMGGTFKGKDCLLEYFILGDNTKYTFSGHAFKDSLSNEEKAYFSK